MALPAMPSGEQPKSRDVERLVLAVIAREPTRVWRATDVLDEFEELDLLEILPALAQLTYRGDLTRIAAGRYRLRRPGEPAGDTLVGDDE
jgi:hypothetical protein